MCFFKKKSLLSFLNTLNQHWAEKSQVKSNFIEKLSHSIKNCTELAGREESNIIDILFTLLLKSNKNQNNILSYIEKKLSHKYYILFCLPYLSPL